jgi:hypothetical protein
VPRTPAHRRPPARHAARAHPRPASKTAQHRKQHRRRTERAGQAIVTAAAAGQLIQLAVLLAETIIHVLGH